MEYYWAYGLLLLFTGLGFAALEVFFPSGGVLGFLSLVSLIGGVVLGFMHSVLTGVIVILLTIVGLPVTLVFALTWLPKTRFGRRFLLLQDGDATDSLPKTSYLEKLKSLEGRIGHAQTKMLPAGVIKVDGQSIDAVSQGRSVDPGQPVRVIKVQGNCVVVEPISPDEIDSNVSDDENLLNRPIDSINDGVDPFDSK
jgi:membrane-bound ClpP family serine protease